MSNLRTYYKIGSVFAGIVWIAAAVCSMFDGIVPSILSVICFLIATIIAAMKVFRPVRDDAFDEMAELHHMKAKAKAFDALAVIVLAVSVIQFSSFQLKGQTVALMMLGVGELVLGLKFLDLEKNGD